MSQVLIKAENVSKKFCRGLKRSLVYGVWDIARDLVGAAARSHTLRTDEFWAVHDVSFELHRGECLGLIGRNGAGKTTLLRILNGLIKPDGGRITMHGRIGALIALGAGFNPVLTGRENIYVNASILGLGRHEIDQKISEIIDFAEIDEFIDTPVQSYSSGMQVRLGFAIATALKPDVLLLDEVLAVGDAGFRAKCYNRLAKIHDNAAVIFVSHDMGYVSHVCDRVLHFQKGISTAYADVMDGVAAYNEDNKSSSAESLAGSRVMFPPIQDAAFSLGSALLGYGDSLEVTLQLETERALHQPLISLVGFNEAGLEVFCWHTNQFDAEFEIPAGRSELRFPLEPLWLHSGRYTCSIMIVEEGTIEHILWLDREVSFTVETGKKPVCNIPLLMPYRGHTVKSVADIGAEKQGSAFSLREPTLQTSTAGGGRR